MLKRKPKIKENSKVRIPYNLRSVDKAYFPNWSDRIETVKNVIKDLKKPYFILNDIEGRFYPEQVQEVEEDVFRVERIIRKRRRNNREEFLIKWVGYPEEYNSWEPAKNIITADKSN